MKKILENWILAPQGAKDLKGLSTFPAPTGFGKTHITNQFIAENFDEIVKRKIKIIFITPLLKNLPVDGLRLEFEKLGKLNEFDRNFLLLQSINDVYLNQLLKIKSQIPPELQSSQHLKRMLSMIEQMTKLTGKQVLTSSDLDVSNFTNAFTECEQAFRKELTNLIFYGMKKKEAKLKQLELPQNRWVKVLYPSTQFENTPIVMMSVKKFILPFVTLVERSKPLVEVINAGTVVIMDEFDSCKQDIQQTIIESGLKHKYDPVALVKTVYAKLMQTKPSQEFLNDSTARQKQMKTLDWQTTHENYEMLIARLEEVFKDFNLQFNLKTDEQMNSRNFLFHDFKTIQVMGGFTAAITDKQERINRISHVKNEQGVDYQLSHLVSAIQNVMRYFRQNITYNARNYLEKKNQNRELHIDEMLLDHAIKTVLNEYGVPENGGFWNRFFDAALHYEYNLRFKQIKHENLHSFYDLGFSYFALEDDPEHDTFTTLNHYAFYDTADSYLIYLCDKAKVIGLSATAEYQTPLKNFSIEYLQNKLAERFIPLTFDEVSRLEAEFQKRIQGYQKVKIQTQKLPGLVDFKEDLADIFEDSDLVEELANRVSFLSDYVKQRYLNLFYFISQFVKTEDMYAGLGLFSALAKSGSQSFDSELITNVFKLLTQNQTNLQLKLLSSKNYENELADVKKNLAIGNRVLVISSYSTLGAGQNLQYDIPQGRSTVQTHESADERPQMDFNGLYLDKVTRIIPNPSANSEYYTEADAVDRLFKVESLFEEGDISSVDKESHIRHSLAALYNEHATNKSKLTENRSYYNAVAVTIAQATGRLCRTANKAANIYLFIHHELATQLSQADIPNPNLILPEFKTILEACHHQSQNTQIIQLMQKAQNHNATSAHIIASLMRYITNPNNIENWQSLRYKCLATPNFTQPPKDWLESMYFKLPQTQSHYWYKICDPELREVQISHQLETGYKSTQVLSDALESVMHNSEIKAYFQANGWATTLHSANYWLVPVMLKNIYQGALGEEIGRYIFEHNLGIKLHEMPSEHYEVFDFKVKEGVYIDFKFWLDYEIDALGYKIKIEEKLKKLNAKKVLVINVPTTSSDKPLNLSTQIIEIPSLLIQGQLNPEAVSAILGALNDE